MIRIQIVLLLILAINTIANGQSPTEQTEKTEGWELISGEEYEIKYPSTWEVDKSGQMGASFILFSPLSSESDKFRENVNLLFQDLTGHNLNLDKYVEISEGQIKTMITEGTIIASDRKKKEETPYHRIIYTGKQGAFKLKFEQYYWVIDNRAIVLTFTCEEDQFDKYQNTGEAILSSFKLK